MPQIPALGAATTPTSASDIAVIVQGVNAKKVTLANLLPGIAANTVMGSVAGGTPIALTQTQLATLLTNFQQVVLSRYRMNVISHTGNTPLTLDPAIHMASWIRDDTGGGAELVVTLPAVNVVGFTCTFSAYGGGDIRFVADTSVPAITVTLYNRQGHTRTAGLDAVVGIVCIDTDGATYCDYELYGDTKA